MLGQSQAQDHLVANPPTDSVSSLVLNGSLNSPPTMLIATSWDCSVRAYQIQFGSGGYGGVGQVNATFQYQITHDAPVLCADINTQDNMTVYSGSCDGVIKMWNVAQGPNAAQVLGKHDSAVKNIKYVHDLNLLLTSSWDKTLKVWDFKSQNPVATLTFQEKIVAMDAKGFLAVLITINNQISIINLNTGNKEKEYPSPLTYQARTITIFNDLSGFAIGSIEGRVALEFFEEIGLNLPKDKKRSFAFKCHRDNNEIYPVNAVQFHPIGTFLTASSDGTITTWDMIVKFRISTFDKFKKQIPITDARFSPNGQILAYATGYDWSKGIEGNNPNFKTNIYLHMLNPAEFNPKDPKDIKKK